MARPPGTKRLPLSLGSCLFCLACLVGAATAGPLPTTPDIEMFVRAGCPRCAEAEAFLEALQRERPTLRILLRDVAQEPAALVRLNELAASHGIATIGVPAFSLRGELLIGYAGPETTGARLRTLLDRPPARSVEPAPEGACVPEAAKPCESASAASPPDETVETRLFGRLDAREMGLPAFTLAIGLLDGFNPCAMWVLLFLLSLLVNLQDRKKMALLAGTFVAVSGLAYYALMAAWLNLFLLIGLSRGTQVALGLVACLVGLLNVKDFLSFGQGPSLSIPEAAKPRLYVQVRRILQADNLTGALVAVVVLAVLVNLVELLCTAGFPAVYTQILTLHKLPWWEYYAYLGLYNVAYILDDGVMVAIAVVTLSRCKLQERAGRWLKLVSGAVMVGLGLVLIFEPGWLAW